MTPYLQVQITFPNPEEANQMAAQLVAHKLAACCQVEGPIRSHYLWQGQLESQPEFRLLAKTKTSLFDALEAWVRQNHSYQVPQILALPISHVSKPYAQWLEECFA